MNIRQAYKAWRFNRDLRIAKKRFDKVRRNSVYEKMSRPERRRVWKNFWPRLSFRQTNIPHINKTK